MAYLPELQDKRNVTPDRRPAAANHDARWFPPARATAIFLHACHWPIRHVRLCHWPVWHVQGAHERGRCVSKQRIRFPRSVLPICQSSLLPTGLMSCSWQRGSVEETKNPAMGSLSYQPVGPSGMTFRLESRGTSVQIHFGSPFSSEIVV